MLRPKSGPPYRPRLPPHPSPTPSRPNHSPYPTSSFSGRGRGFRPSSPPYRGGIRGRGGSARWGRGSVEERYPPPPNGHNHPGGSGSYRGRGTRRGGSHSFDNHLSRHRPDYPYRKLSNSDKSRPTHYSGSNSSMKPNSEFSEQREYPCRCLFVRNIEKYTAREREVSELFSRYGEIKYFKDKIADNGVAYITFFDIRSAETARGELNAHNLKGRPLDVHFSFPNPFSDRATVPLPKDNQGSIKLFFRRSEYQPTQDQLHDHFSRFGEISDIQATSNPQLTILSFYDSRASVSTLKHSDNHLVHGSEISVTLAWDKFAPLTREDQYHIGSSREPGPYSESSNNEINSRPRPYRSHSRSESHHHHEPSPYPKDYHNDHSKDHSHENRPKDNFGFLPTPDSIALGPLSTQELIEKAQQAQVILDYIKNQTTIKLPESSNDYYRSDSFRSPPNPISDGAYYQEPQTSTAYTPSNYYKQGLNSNSNPSPAHRPASTAPSPYHYGTNPSPSAPPPQPYYPINDYDPPSYSQPADTPPSPSTTKDTQSNPEVNQLLQLLAQANSKHGRP